MQEEICGPSTTRHKAPPSRMQHFPPPAAPRPRFSLPVSSGLGAVSRHFIRRRDISCRLVEGGGGLGSLCFGDH
ncbi:hypothetical protein E2C01_072342 [Portunus trituberculatus]|uniref:Uncharacterized protein n=1 Tax=Portunus trituberculatus TaxID=210409 RepID=A0A5B7I6G2_PORTR|nr:hypothetical protein [Portunus trituberculatus]